MNEQDRRLIERIKTRPWPELTLCGVSAVEQLPPALQSEVAGLALQLACVAPGAEPMELALDVDAQNAPEAFDWMRTFCRGAIPVAWGSQSKTALHRFAGEHHGSPTPLCFVLRPKSRWLDPMIWVRVRTGKFHKLAPVLKAAKVRPSGNRGLDLVRLAQHLPTRKQFPVRSAWTASDAADWQELQQIF